MISQDEAKQTRIDLDLANNEINELKKELYTTNKQCEEKQFSVNILLKKSKTMEEELFEKRDVLLKTQMQYKMTVGKHSVCK